MNRKAVSAVVATALIVLITIAAVAILWTAIIPLVSNSVPKENPCLGVSPNIEIVTACKKTDNTISLRVRVGDTDAVIKQIKAIVYNTAGQSTNEQKVPTAGDLKRNTESDIPLTNIFLDAARLSIAPIVASGSNTKECDASAQIILSACA